MATNTGIEWTDKTWNPVVGCDKVSPGCDRCYAETMANRFGAPAYPNGFQVTLKPHKMDDPIKWKTPCRVFVNSMSDLFHAKIPDSYIAEVFDVMACCPQHQFQVLTKRPRMMRDWCQANVPEPLPNVWLGVSVEDFARLNRLPYLAATPAAVRFVSFEPLIGLIPERAATPELKGIDWIIIGGESGTGARPMTEGMALELIRAGRNAGCAVFVKQMGEVWKRVKRAKGSKGGDWSEWPESLRVREYPRELEVE